MLTDCVLFICLICAIECILILSLNKAGYAFTLVDSFVLSLAGIAAFLVPFGLVRFISGILF